MNTFIFLNAHFPVFQKPDLKHFFQDIPGEDMTQLDLKRCPEETFRPSPVQPKKPKASRRKKKRDPNEPQKPVSAYALFFRDSQASIKGRNPNLTFGDVSKMVASLWDSLDSESKALYKKRTEMAKKEYLRQLASYRASLVSKGQAEDMFGFPGYGYPHMGVGQNIPPHPPSAPSQSINQVSPGGQGFHPSNEFNNQVIHFLYDFFSLPFLFSRHIGFLLILSTFINQSVKSTKQLRNLNQFC